MAQVLQDILHEGLEEKVVPTEIVYNEVLRL